MQPSRGSRLLAKRLGEKRVTVTTSSGLDLSYDDVPYPDLCYAVTHPGRLAAIGRLLNIQPVQPQACRVLEIGCAGGGNIVPMAFSLPDSTFVGIDLSARQVDAATDFAGRLGLTNVQLRAMDMMDVTAEFGEFDYIVAHGMYSWVPPAVQDKILSICRQNLSPRGIAYVSYNTFPGWHMLSMAREMMLYHTRNIAEPRARAQQARAVIKRFRAMVPDDDQFVLASFLDAYVDTRLGSYAGNDAWEDSSLLHDELGAINDPLYFHQFVAHAQRHGLRYLAEATYPQTMTHDLPPETIAELHDMAGDVIEFEQSLDYVRQQSFRRTLLCHEAVHIDRTPGVDGLHDLYAVSRARLVSNDDGRLAFRSSDGASFLADDPVTTAALDHLSVVSPRAIHFPALLYEACARVGRQPTQSMAKSLAADLLQASALSNQHAEWLAYDPALSAFPSERPLASPVVRLQAQQSALVCNLRHEQMVLSGLGRALVPFLDGVHTRGDMLGELLSMLDEGRMSAPKRQTVRSDQIEQQLSGDIERTLLWLGRAAILLR
jgi:SAM-dependent methyltransferase/methyltransferase-like protein